MTEFGGVRVPVGLSCDLCVLNLNEHLCCAVIRDCCVVRAGLREHNMDLSMSW